MRTKTLLWTTYSYDIDLSQNSVSHEIDFEMDISKIHSERYFNGNLYMSKKLEILYLLDHTAAYSEKKYRYDKMEKPLKAVHFEPQY